MDCIVLVRWYVVYVVYSVSIWWTWTCMRCVYIWGWAYTVLIGVVDEYFIIYLWKYTSIKMAAILFYLEIIYRFFFIIGHTKFLLYWIIIRTNNAFFSLLLPYTILLEFWFNWLSTIYHIVVVVYRLDAFNFQVHIYKQKHRFFFLLFVLGLIEAMTIRRTTRAQSYRIKNLIKNVCVCVCAWVCCISLSRQQSINLSDPYGNHGIILNYKQNMYNNISDIVSDDDCWLSTHIQEKKSDSRTRPLFQCHPRRWPVIIAEKLAAIRLI